MNSQTAGLPNMPPRGIVEAGIAILLAGLVAAAGLLTYRSLGEVRHTLGSEVLEHQGMISELVADFSVLEHRLRIGELESSEAVRGAIRQQVDATTSSLRAMQRDFSFGSLDGAAATYSIARPATLDVANWLQNGLPGYAADTPLVLRQARRRVVEARRRMEAVAGRGSAHAQALLQAEAARIERFQTYVLISLGLLALLTVAAIAFYLSQRKARAAARSTQLQLEMTEHRLTGAIKHVSEGIALYDRADRLQLWNAPYEEAFANSGVVVRGRRFDELLQCLLPEIAGSQRDTDPASSETEERSPSSTSAASPLEVELPDGRYLKINEYTTPENDKLVIQTDITEQKKVQDALEFQAYYDPLTGLPNRTLFKKRLDQSASECRRHNRRMSVLAIDLDKFKPVNDTYGHAAGDKVLIAIGERLAETLRNEDTPARIGGDEFIAILTDVRGSELLQGTAARLVQRLGQSVNVGTADVSVGASIGIATYPDDAEDINALVQLADAACYHAKRQGRNQYQVYDPRIVALDATTAARH